MKRDLTMMELMRLAMARTYLLRLQEELRRARMIGASVPIAFYETMFCAMLDIVWREQQAAVVPGGQ